MSERLWLLEGFWGLVDAVKRIAGQCFGVLGLVLAVSSPALAQAPANSLVPGSIAPYAPRAAPSRAQGQAPAGTAPKAGATLVDVQGAHQAGYDYVLGAGDKLRITVFEEEDLSGEFTVAGNGMISFPLIGDVPAQGKTVQAVQTEIVAKLSDGYIKDPRVSAEVLTFRPYYILGEVSKPGEYPYSDGMTVMNAVATAGGFTYRANSKFIFIKKADQTAEQRVRLDASLVLAPGDTVRVGPRLF